MKKKKFLSLVLVLAMVLTQILAGIPAYGASEPDRFTFDISEGNITVAAGSTANTLKVTYGSTQTTSDFSNTQEINITQTNPSIPTTNKVVVNGVTANITINGVNIQETADGACAFALTNSANVTLTLVGISSLKSGKDVAGISVATGQSITINGTGSIDVTGGVYGSGIGGGKGKTGGNITIKGGTVNATGGNSGAGIGGAEGGEGGNITIAGGTINATGGRNGAGIGGGGYGAGGNVTIEGGTVTAIGSEGAGIGDGFSQQSGKGGHITIKTLAIVRAVSNYGALAIHTANSDGSLETSSTAKVLMANFQSGKAANITTEVYDNSSSCANFTPTVAYQSIALTVPPGTYQLKTGGKLQQQGSPTPSTNFGITGNGLAIFNNVGNASTDATLSDLRVAGTTVMGFSGTVDTYNVTLPAGTTTVPTVVATVKDTGANATVTPVASLPWATTVLVTAADGTTKKTYTINFTVAAATAPGAPTITGATAGNRQASVSFTPPASNGGSAITGYTVTASPGGLTGTGTASPIIVSGLTNGTAYTFTVTATNAAGTGSASAASNAVTPQKPTMTGTVAITAGIAKFGQTITATPSVTNGGNLTYQWNRGGVAISGATVSTYTLTEDDIGKTITVTVTADGSEGTGSISSEATASIEKADGPSAPDVAPDIESKTATSVTLKTNALYEYSKDNGATWQDSGIFTGLTQSTEYTFVARVKATSTTKESVASAGTKITTEKPTMTGTVAITAGITKFGQTITATPSLTNGGTVTYQWNRNGVPISGAIGSNYTLKEEDIGKSITVTVTADGSVGTGSITSSGTGTIAKADGPSAPSIAPAMKSKTQTSVTLTTNALYEYSKDNGTTWQDSGLFTGLTQSTEYTFVVRVKETSTTNASVASAGTKITTDAAPYIPPYIPPTPVPDPTPPTKPDSKPEQTPIKGDVIDKNGESVKGIEAQVSTETNGNKTVEVKSKDAILVKQPDGTKATLADVSKLKLEVKDNAKVSISADGTIQVKDLAKGTETKISVTYDLGNGQKICMGTMEVKVDSNGDVSLTSTLIDPYGTITDAATGKVIEGADVKLYYANTERNKVAGKTPDTLVQLPIIDGFKPNDNKNPQISDVSGAYGFMVFPTTDYYIVATKDGYNEFKSPTIPVEQDIVKLDFKMNKPRKGLDRLSGLNRVDTAIEIAKKSYTGKLSNVILATADGYSDALAGSVLAYKLNAPILLVGSSAADQEKVLAYIKANMDGAGTVYILGGTGVVTSAFEANVAASGFKNITRLGGANRYETSLKIANKLDTKVGTPVVLAYGEDYPDALSISSTAAVMQYPILLVEKDKISDAVKQKLAEIKPTKVYIIGLKGVINASVEDQVIQATALTKGNIVRIGGQDRYETSLAVAKYFNLNGQNVCIATGNNYPDALAGSVYAANSNSPIILADGSLSENVINYLKTRKITGATIFGGEAVVSKEVEKKISELIVK